VRAPPSWNQEILDNSLTHLILPETLPTRTFRKLLLAWHIPLLAPRPRRHFREPQAQLNSSFVCLESFAIGLILTPCQRCRTAVADLHAATCSLRGVVRPSENSSPGANVSIATPANLIAQAVCKESGRNPFTANTDSPKKIASTISCVTRNGGSDCVGANAFSAGTF
jgi:hypothetical protein